MRQLKLSPLSESEYTSQWYQRRKLTGYGIRQPRPTHQVSEPRLHAVLLALHLGNQVVAGVFVVHMAHGVFDEAKQGQQHQHAAADEAELDKGRQQDDFARRADEPSRRANLALRRLVGVNGRVSMLMAVVDVILAQQSRVLGGIQLVDRHDAVLRAWMKRCEQSQRIQTAAGVVVGAISCNDGR